MKYKRFLFLLCFVFFIFAVFSLILFGFNKDSYSIDLTNLDDEVSIDYLEYDYDEPVIISSMSDNGTLEIALFCANLSVPVYLFDIDYNKSILGGQYVKNNQVDDVGLLYILNKSGTYNGTGIIDKNDFSTESYIYYEQFATQLAIFAYLKRKGIATSEVIDESKFKKYSTFVGHGYSGGPYSKIPLIEVNFYEKYVLPIVNSAEKVSNARDFKISFKDKNTLIDKGDYYQSSMINVSADSLDDLNDYIVSIDGLDGAKVVDGDGKELNGEINNSFFYINIPKNKIENKAANITVTANATFNNYIEGYEYIHKYHADDYQSVIIAKSISKTISSGDSIEISGSKDTSLFKNKMTIYLGVAMFLVGTAIIFISLLYFVKNKLKKAY